MQHGPLAICDFVVKIFTTDTAEAGRYEVSVESVAGDTEPNSIHLDAEAMIDRRQELEHTLLSSAVRTRRAVPPNEQPLHDVGELLFKAVFDGPIYGRYTASLATAQERVNRSEWCSTSPPSLRRCPGRQCSTGTNTSRGVSRWFGVSLFHLRYDLLPSLGHCGSSEFRRPPKGLPTLDVGEEQQRLTDALGEHIDEGRIALDWEDSGTWQAVQRKLLNSTWHIVHFIGHGSYDEKAKEGVLAMVGSNGRSDLRGAGDFADLLGLAYLRPSARSSQLLLVGRSGRPRPVFQHRGYIGSPRHYCCRGYAVRSER